MVARPWSSSRLPVESASSVDATGTPGILSRHTVKGYLISSYEGEKGLLWMWAVSHASSRVETGMSGNFLSCSKGVKDPLEVPEVRCD